MVYARLAGRGRAALRCRARRNGRLGPRGRRDERRDGDRNVARRSFLYPAPSARQLGYRRRALRVATFSRRRPLHEMKRRSRADADSVREKYKDSETIRRLTPLLARPRDRWVTCEDEAPGA